MSTVLDKQNYDDEDEEEEDDEDEEGYREIEDDEKGGSWRSVDQYWNLILKYFKYRGKIQL